MKRDEVFSEKKLRRCDFEFNMEVDYIDPDFEVLNAVRAVKSLTTNGYSEQNLI